MVFQANVAGHHRPQAGEQINLIIAHNPADLQKPVGVASFRSESVIVKPSPIGILSIFAENNRSIAEDAQ